MDRLRSKALFVLSVAVFVLPFLWVVLTNLHLTPDHIVRAIITTINPSYGLPPATTPWLTTQGNRIIDGNGKPLILRGVNISSINWSPEYDRWNSQAVTHAATNWHANVIRTRLYEQDFQKDPQGFLDKIEQQIVAPARAHNAYVILHPWIGDNQSLPSAVTKRMWITVARRYRDDPTILYDPLAEPRDVSPADLEAAYKDLVPAIRQVNPRSLILVTGSNWGRDINEWLSHPLPYPNLVYRSNPYNKAGEFEGMVGAMAQKYPVLIGEFGTSPDLSMQLADVNDLLGFAQTLNLSWTAWNFSATGCPCLLDNEDTYHPSLYGQLVTKALNTPEAFTYPSLTFTDTKEDSFPIYTDYLNNGFMDYSWKNAIALTNNTATHSGLHSLKVVAYPQGGLYLKTERRIPLPNYTTLSFYLKAANPGLFTARVTDSTTATGPTVNLKDYAKADKSGWLHVAIPTKNLGLSTMSSLIIEATPELKTPATLFFDDITLEK